MIYLILKKVTYLLLLLFGMKLRWFPVIGHDNPLSLVCAAFVLALPMIGSLTRVLRSLILEEKENVLTCPKHQYTRELMVATRFSREDEPC